MLAIDQHVLASQFDDRILVQIRVVFNGLVGDHGRYRNTQEPIWLQQTKRFFKRAPHRHGDVFENVARTG